MFHQQNINLIFSSMNRPSSLPWEHLCNTIWPLPFLVLRGQPFSVVLGDVLCISCATLQLHNITSFSFFQSQPRNNRKQKSFRSSRTICKVFSFGDFLLTYFNGRGRKNSRHEPFIERLFKKIVFFLFLFAETNTQLTLLLSSVLFWLQRFDFLSTDVSLYDALHFYAFAIIKVSAKLKIL